MTINDVFVRTRYVSLTDLFSWDFYEKHKNENLVGYPVIGENPQSTDSYFAWHLPPRSIFHHTRRHRLMVAICDNDIKETKRVLDEGFDINTQQIDVKKGYNSMTLASSLNHTSLVDYQILRGGDINSCDKYGLYPINYAIHEWNFQTIQLLVNRGADLYVKDKYGRNLEQNAHDRGLYAIEEYIKESKQEKLDRESSGKPTKSKIHFDINQEFEELLDTKSKDRMIRNRTIYKTPIAFPFNTLSDLFVICLYNPWKLSDSNLDISEENSVFINYKKKWLESYQQRLFNFNFGSTEKDDTKETPQRKRFWFF